MNRVMSWEVTAWTIQMVLLAYSHIDITLLKNLNVIIFTD